jgi:hypothetical protein
MSLTFRLVIDSKIPTESKVSKRGTYIQVSAGKPYEDPVDTEGQDIREQCRIFDKIVRLDINSWCDSV